MDSVEQEEQRNATVAAGAAERVEGPLDISAQKRTLGQLHAAAAQLTCTVGRGAQA